MVSDVVRPGRLASQYPKTVLLSIVAFVTVLMLAPLTAGAEDGRYEFSAPVYDLDAAPDGSIIVAEGNSIKEIRRGSIEEVVDIPTVVDSAVTGLGTIGRRSFFATSGRVELQAEEADLWRVSQGGARLVADIGAFDTAHDPDALEGPRWKDPQQCEGDEEFSAGPQSNPYHLTTLSGSEALVADAAGNTLLSAKTNGNVDWVAVFTPPVDQNGDWRVLFPLDGDADCYVEPVPTSVDIGPDGSYYVGELTGAPAVPGWSRVWRIESGARNVVCPSDACEVVIDGLTSVIDVAFGPDGKLYVVEFDENGWLAAVTGSGSGGTVKSCDVGTGECDVVEDELELPGAVTFDKWDQMWLLENNILTGVATVSRVALP